MYVGMYVINLLSPHSQGCPGWELLGGGLEWIAYSLHTFHHPDRLVEIMHSTADKKDGHAPFLLELALEASHCPFT